MEAMKYVRRNHHTTGSTFGKKLLYAEWHLKGRIKSGHMHMLPFPNSR